MYPDESSQWLSSICSKVYEYFSDDKMPQDQNCFEFIWPNPRFFGFLVFFLQAACAAGRRMQGEQAFLAR